MFRRPARPVRSGLPGPEGYTDTIAGHQERHPRAAARGLLRKRGRHPFLAKRRSLFQAVLSPADRARLTRTGQWRGGGAARPPGPPARGAWARGAAPPGGGVWAAPPPPPPPRGGGPAPP